MHKLQLREGDIGTFYHRTTESRWKLIQKEGVLWGYSKSLDSSDGAYRYTYLSPTDFGDSFGSVLLEVTYKPVGINGLGIDNYGFDPPDDSKYCWQFSVFVPIDLSKVKKII